MGANIDALDPDLRQGLLELQQLCGQAGLLTTVTSTVRSARDQDFLWRRYKRGDSPLPAAPPGHSAHEYGWAFDMVVSPGEYQANVGRAWEEQWGGKWGGKRDPVHFELPGASQLAWQLGEQGAQTATPDVAGLRPSDAPTLLKVLDFFSSFSPLGVVQLADNLAEIVAPATGKYDRILQALIQYPSETLYEWARSI